jgi:hypothetical protein
MRITALLLATAALYVSVAAAQSPRLERLMRDKLVSSQQAFTAVVTSDWETLTRETDRLIEVTENVEWMVLKTPDYERYSTEFVTAVERLGEAAETRSLDEAGIAFADLTIRCVNCHRYVAGARLATPLRR